MHSSIERLASEFTASKDGPVALANAIEVALDDAFPDDDYVQQTVEMLAMYRPDGGDFTFDTAAIRRRLSETINYLRSVAAVRPVEAH